MNVIVLSGLCASLSHSVNTLKLKRSFTKTPNGSQIAICETLSDNQQRVCLLTFVFVNCIQLVTKVSQTNIYVQKKEKELKVPFDDSLVSAATPKHSLVCLFFFHRCQRDPHSWKTTLPKLL